MPRWHGVCERSRCCGVCAGCKCCVDCGVVCVSGVVQSHRFLTRNPSQRARGESIQDKRKCSTVENKKSSGICKASW